MCSCPLKSKVNNYFQLSICHKSILWSGTPSLQTGSYVQNKCFINFAGSLWQRRTLENWAIICMSTVIQGTVTQALETHPEQITLEDDSSYVATCRLTVYQDLKTHSTILVKHPYSLAVKAYLQERWRKVSVDGNWFKWQGNEFSDIKSVVRYLL